MIHIDNPLEVKLPLKLLNQIFNYMGGGDLELIFVNDQDMATLNKKYRQKDSSTDVLSFPLDRQANPHLPLGSIVISYDYALKGSELFRHSLQDEITLLFVHGLLHLLGFDHEQDHGEHRAKEKEIIQHFKLPPSLIIRTESL